MYVECEEHKPESLKMTHCSTNLYSTMVLSSVFHQKQSHHFIRIVNKIYSFLMFITECLRFQKTHKGQVIVLLSCSASFAQQLLQYLIQSISCFVPDHISLTEYPLHFTFLRNAAGIFILSLSLKNYCILPFL